MVSRWGVWARLALLGLLALMSAGAQATAPRADTRPVAYVGAAACVRCHAKEGEAWRNSDHFKSMAAPTPQTVVGDFNNAHFTLFGDTTQFSTRDGQYFITTLGPSGATQRYPVKYTFGYYPLQQYLIDVGDGKLQAFSLAWDNRPAAAGGQRWYALYPKERIAPDDPLHWSGRYQNWNFMCADCHSTQVRQNYDARTDRFDTRWNEINVACEACHGPGARHLAWAQQAHNPRTHSSPDKGLVVGFATRKDPAHLARILDPNTALSFKEGPELMACAVCHARRSALTNEFKPGEGFNQHFKAELLSESLYHADGQIKDEVYEYNSFRQSRMFAKGVTCTDCHDPHSARLRAATPQATCLGCHREAYATTRHTHHTDAAATQCVSCHMPTTTYMGVDARRDHSFRIPRPDLSATLATPDACTRCHREQGARWAAAAITRWFGPQRSGFQRFGETLAALRSGAPEAESLLHVLLDDAATPPVARATALAESGSYLEVATEAVRRDLHAGDPTLRSGALAALEGLPPAQRWRLAQHLLRDPVRSIRIDAARLLADGTLNAAQRRDLAPALSELEETVRVYGSRAEWHMVWGNVAAALGNAALAEAEYRKALDRQPSLTAGFVNLADLQRRQGQDAAAVATLDAGLARLPGDAALHYARGLAALRAHQPEVGMAHIQQAYALDGKDPAYAYAYALAVFSKGNAEAAFAVIRESLQQAPYNRQLLALAQHVATQAGHPEWLAPYRAALDRRAHRDSATYP